LQRAEAEQLGEVSQPIPALRSEAYESISRNHADIFGRRQELNWNERLSELANYRDIHGHCNVPTNYSQNKSLGTWVSNQRIKYKWRGQDDRNRL
jgi:hypothetical protein